jgi:SAM-dependent methyltransferase
VPEHRIVGPRLDLQAQWPVPENYFDERIAATYEAKWPELFEPAVVAPAVSFLADLARSGTALELGIGTGRLALPLSQRGIRVHGIELSPAMIARLQAKPGADGICVTTGDFTTAKVNATFGLAYLVRNTIMNLTTQDRQVKCFGNVAAVPPRVALRAGPDGTARRNDLA